MARIKGNALLPILLVLFLLPATCPSTSTVQAAPPAQTSTAWTGSYFANLNLQGTPVFVRQDPNIDFAWGRGSPGTGLSADEFSARWVRWFYVDTPGNWTFTTITDDGVRLYVDEVLVLDAWYDQTLSTRSTTLNLSQTFHLIRMEYYQHGGKAEAHLYLTSPDFPNWRGEYYSNADLTGTPIFTRDDHALVFNFGTAGPGGGIPGTNFSVRWNRPLYLAAGRYRFTTTTDDGVRLWVDGQLLIDQWHDQTVRSWSSDTELAQGNHWIKMEYFQRGGAALATLNWTLLSGAGEVWHGEYFDNPGLGGTPVLARDDSALSFDWGSVSPGRGIQAVNWSARWTSRRTTSTPGFYTVVATADDGVRVWLDNSILIDEWHDQSTTPHGAMTYLNAGVHDWKVEYYQHTGTASLRVQINRGVTEPALAPALNSAGWVLDDGAPGFFKSPSGWRDSSGGYGGHALAMQNSTFPRADAIWARWYPQLSQPGMYEVSVYIPADLATTRNAQYLIVHSTDYDWRTVNQSLSANQWVSLGTFHFDASGTEYVSISDTTYEPLNSTLIAVDAIKFTPR